MTLHPSVRAHCRNSERRTRPLSFAAGRCCVVSNVRHRFCSALLMNRLLNSGQGADLPETREWADPAGGVIEASYS